MGGSPSGVGGFGTYPAQPPGNFDWGNLFGGPAAGSTKPLQAQNPAGALDKPNPNGVGSLDWMKWHPDYKPTVGTAAWGATHPDPAQNVKYGSAQWQQTHPNYGGFGGQQQPQLGQPSGDLSDVIRRLFGGGQ